MYSFIHIPKTAGTTLHKILSHQFSNREIIKNHDKEGEIDQAKVSEWETQNIKLVMGHQSVGAHLFNDNVRYMTCLRDPISRIISHYNYAKDSPDHYLHQMIHESNMDLVSYVTSGRSRELSNGMTRLLSGVEKNVDIVDRESLELAKFNLEEYFDAVLFTENFDEGLIAMAQKFNFSSPYYIRRKVGRSGKSGDPIDFKTKETIRDLNLLDIELYNWAKRNFEGSDFLDAQLKCRVKNFKRKNVGIGKYIYYFREFKRYLF